MALDLKIESQNRAVAAYLRRLRALTNDFTELMDEIGMDVAEMVRLQFRDSRSPYGQAWAPLKFRSGKPLLDTGRLRNSITHRASRSSVEIGTNFPYAPTHQYGATIRPRRARFLVFKPPGFKRPIFAKQVTIPARKFLPTDGLPPDYRSTVLAALVPYLRRAEKQAGANA